MTTTNKQTNKQTKVGGGGEYMQLTIIPCEKFESGAFPRGPKSTAAHTRPCYSFVFPSVPITCSAKQACREITRTD